MHQAPGLLFCSPLLWITAVLAAVFLYFKFVIYTYWKRHGIPHEPAVIPFGNVLPIALGKMSMGNVVKEHYDKFRKHRFSGMYMFHEPVLMINDPELIRQVLVKEFNKFRDRGFYHNAETDPLTSNLGFLPGDKWKRLRTKLSPTFTSRKMKEMFPLVREISDHLVVTCDKELAESHIIDVKSLMSRYATDTISSIAFGFNCKSLDNPDSEFKRYGHMAFHLPPIKSALVLFVSVILDVLHIPLFDKEMTNFFTKLFQDMVEHRKQHNIVRKDLVNLLMQLMDEGVSKGDVNDELSSENKITMVEAQAQAFIFFLAGFETTSSTITYLLYELAMNPEVQDKLHQEIDEFLAGGEVTYDRMKNELKYLDMVFSETLRKHSSFALLNRRCTEDWQIPDSDYVIKKGAGVIISVSGLHHNPDIHPDPEKFDPERFSDENVAARPPYAYLAWGDGPRNCIGARFAIVQSKLAAIAVLSNYKLYRCDETPVPVRYSERSFTQTPGGGVYLRMEKRIK